MGIGAPKKASGITPKSGASSTASFVAPQAKQLAPVVVLPTAAAATDSALPPSYETSEAEEFAPNVLLRPTGDNDLNYFHALAAGEVPQFPPSSGTLVMNLFRTTQCHLFPIDERIALGATLAQPFYSLQSSPSATSVDEFNKLTISRRSPARAFWTKAILSEIQPRLNLLANGVMIIARITVMRGQNLGQLFDLTWEKSKDSYTVWSVAGSTATPTMDVRCDSWESLNDAPGDNGGVIRAKSRDNTLLGPNQDLAVLDARKPSLQMISASYEGHKMMDILVGSLLTVAIVHSRMAKLGRLAKSGGSGPNVTVNVNVNVNRTYIF